MKATLEKYFERARLALEDATYLLKVRLSFGAASSRAYYAMFYAAEAILFSKNITTSSHNATISLFGFHFVKTGIFPPYYGKILSNAFEKRQVGDYDIFVEITQQEAEDVLNNAIDFVDKTEAYLKNAGLI
ncbi:MAG: HEPN domain-containing protein [Bacteroidota bacterium]